MSYINVSLHYIWATKNREPFITPDIKSHLLSHIRENCRCKGIYLDTVNCVADHIHLLVSLDAEQTISKVAQLIKGESSHWVNNSGLTDIKFGWQDDYIALSVSESARENVRRYIIGQEEHHKEKTFANEYDSLLKLNGFQS